MYLHNTIYWRFVFDKITEKRRKIGMVVLFHSFSFFSHFVCFIFVRPTFCVAWKSKIKRIKFWANQPDKKSAKQWRDTPTTNEEKEFVFFFHEMNSSTLSDTRITLQCIVYGIKAHEWKSTANGWKRWKILIRSMNSFRRSSVNNSRANWKKGAYKVERSEIYILKKETEIN